MYSTNTPLSAYGLGRRRKKRNTGLYIFVALLLFGVLVVSCAAARSVYQSTEQTVHTVVIDKERVCDGNSNGGTTCKYLVYTEDGTFKLTDTTGFLSGTTRFNTSDTYGRIKPGPATITSMGWRIGFASEYPNILEIRQP